MRRLGYILTIAALWWPATAAAQRPVLTLVHAESVARPALAEAVADGNELVAEYSPGEPTTVAYRLGECDAETRYRVLCDYEQTESNGTVEVGTMELVSTTKGIAIRWL